MWTSLSIALRLFLLQTNLIRVYNLSKVCFICVICTQSCIESEVIILRFYKTGEFAKIIGISSVTLRKWEATGKLIPHHRSPTGYRYYSDEQLIKFFNSEYRIEVDTERSDAICSEPTDLGKY